MVRRASLARPTTQQQKQPFMASPCLWPRRLPIRGSLLTQSRQATLVRRWFAPSARMCWRKLWQQSRSSDLERQRKSALSLPGLRQKMQDLQLEQISRLTAACIWGSLEGMTRSGESSGYSDTQEGTMAEKAVNQTRLIKKYPNRRLYDTQTSTYITLVDVKQLVLDDEDFKVVDAKSGDDLTRSILLQIILEEESGGVPMFSSAMLSQIIRFYGHAMQGIMGAYLEKNIQAFKEVQ